MPSINLHEADILGPSAQGLALAARVGCLVALTLDDGTTVTGRLTAVDTARQVATVTTGGLLDRVVEQLRIDRIVTALAGDPPPEQCDRRALWRIAASLVDWANTWEARAKQHGDHWLAAVPKRHLGQAEGLVRALADAAGRGFGGMHDLHPSDAALAAIMCAVDYARGLTSRIRDWREQPYA